MQNQPPKRILALDGGGIRGALTLGFLERLESIIREKENNSELLLCDYFDLIGGQVQVLSLQQVYRLEKQQAKLKTSI